MQEDFIFELDNKLAQELQAYTEILKKDANTILKEALEQYFENEQKKLLEKNLEDENAMTNLDYDEFWDGIDI
ncbi:MAG: hypothetical protein OQJ77_02525 [Thiovulaceae bacterium]|nr:hypothetical protein [Sulfurimonadaceae bacterium]